MISSDVNPFRISIVVVSGGQWWAPYENKVGNDRIHCCYLYGNDSSEALTANEITRLADPAGIAKTETADSAVQQLLSF